MGIRLVITAEFNQDFRDSYYERSTRRDSFGDPRLHLVFEPCHAG